MTTRERRRSTPLPAGLIWVRDDAGKTTKGRHMASKSARKQPRKSPKSKGIARTGKVKAEALAGIEAGDRAPPFTVAVDGGGTMALADFAGRSLVLYFYPRADTSGCTKEAIDFTRLKPQFKRAGADILGVSADPVSALDAFKAKHRLGIALGSDEKHKMLDAYGVWQEKSMYGRKFLGVVRTTVLIGPDQRVVRVWPKVKVEGHADDVLAAVKAL
ncbi:MAG TPA: peroxiredoxin [Xanthobacteraceae bacterium]|nr:peroxiredoxin [Xanthobacteraceae bacterium]